MAYQGLCHDKGNTTDMNSVQPRQHSNLGLIDFPIFRNPDVARFRDSLKFSPKVFIYSNFQITWPFSTKYTFDIFGRSLFRHEL